MTAGDDGVVAPAAMTPMSEGRPDQKQALNQIVSQLRDHLEQTAQAERLRDEQVERTKDMKRNVIIRIDRKERKKASKRPDPFLKHFDMSRISQCCAPMNRSQSFETPLTKVSTNSNSVIDDDDDDSESLIFQSEESSSLQQVTDLSKESMVVDDAEEKEKEILRLKSDILSIDGVSTAYDFTDADDGHTPIDGVSTANDFTDTDGYTAGYTDDYTDDGSFSLASNYEYAVRAFETTAEALKQKLLSTDDETNEAPSEYKGPTYPDGEGQDIENVNTEDMILNCAETADDDNKEAGKIFIVRSEPSMLMNEREPPVSVDPLANLGGEHPSYVLSAGDSRSLVVSSTSFSHDEVHLEEMEEVRPLLEPYRQTDADSKSFDFKTPDLSLDDSNASKNDDKISEDPANPEDQNEDSTSGNLENTHVEGVAVGITASSSDTSETLKDAKSNPDICGDQNVEKSQGTAEVLTEDVERANTKAAVPEGIGHDATKDTKDEDCKITEEPNKEQIAAILSADTKEIENTKSPTKEIENRESPNRKGRDLPPVQTEPATTMQESPVLVGVPQIDTRNEKASKVEKFIGKSVGSSTMSDTRPPTTPYLVASATLSDLSADANDSISQPSSIVKKIPFVHASFAAAAPFIMHDLKWKRILRKLMPHAHAKAVAQLRRAGSTNEASTVAQMMKWAENNPVVAAYGVITNNHATLPIPDPSTPIASNGHRHAHEIAKALTPAKKPAVQSITPLEWNIFLDPLIVAAVDKAIEATSESRFRRGTDPEVERHISRLIKRCVLSHGTSHQLLSEAMGIYRSFTFAALAQAAGSENVVEPSRTDADMPKGRSSNGDASTKMLGVQDSSAIFLTQWLSRFASAIHLGGQLQNNSIKKKRKDGEDDSSCPEKDLIDEAQPTDQSYCGLLLCVGFEDENAVNTDDSVSSFRASAKSISKQLGGPLRVVLNLRSRHVPPRVWAHLVEYMRANDIWVESVCSFDVDEIRLVSSLMSIPLRHFRLFHSAGDLQTACHNGEVASGDNVFFNAASLIASDQEPLNAFVCGVDDTNEEVEFADYAYPRMKKSNHARRCMATIEDYKKKYRLNIGCYIQEHTASALTLSYLVNFFNRYASIYNLGFAYGGLNGRVATGLRGDGFAKQRLMGREWDDDAKPLHTLQVLNPWHSQYVNKFSRAGGWGQLGTVNHGVRKFA